MIKTVLQLRSHTLVYFLYVYICVWRIGSQVGMLLSVKMMRWQFYLKKIVFKWILFYCLEVQNFWESKPENLRQKIFQVWHNSNFFVSIFKLSTWLKLTVIFLSEFRIIKPFDWTEIYLSYVWKGKTHNFFLILWPPV